jgi:hypothetical protein
VLAARRVADGLAGWVSYMPWWPPMPRTRRRSPWDETDRGLLVGPLLAAGYQVYAANPKVVSRYRGRHALRSALQEFSPGAVAALGPSSPSPRPWPSWSWPRRQGRAGG